MTPASGSLPRKKTARFSTTSTHHAQGDRLDGDPGRLVADGVRGRGIHLGACVNARRRPGRNAVPYRPDTGGIIDTILPTGGESFVVTPSESRIWFWHDGFQAIDAVSGKVVIGPVDIYYPLCLSS
jgi:hypothetical protein